MKIKIFVLIFIISILSYSDEIKILEMEKKLIKNRIEEVDRKIELNGSVIDTLKLNQLLSQKEIEISIEKNNKTKEYFRTKTEIFRVDQTKDILENKLKEYKKKEKILMNNKNNISELDLMKMKVTINNLNEKLIYNRNEKKYYENIIKKLKVDINEKLIDVEELIKKNNFELEYKNIELKELIIENASEKKIEQKNYEIEIAKLNKEKLIEEIIKNRKRVNLDIAKTEMSLNILNEEITIKKKEKEMIIRKVKAGLLNESDLFEVDISYIDMEIKKINLLQEIKYLKMEIKQ